jgi:hypothetical protein
MDTRPALARIQAASLLFQVADQLGGRAALLQRGNHTFM